MEYLDGEDLESLLRRIGRLSQDKASEFARKICAGLSAAHERGVLHRDLKPANIMIDGRGNVQIADSASRLWRRDRAWRRAERNTGVHVAGAEGRKGGYRSERSLFAGAGVIRDVHR